MRPFVLMLLLLLQSPSLYAANIVAEPFPPARFTSLFLERDEKGTSTTLQLAGDAVIYKSMLGATVLETITVHPSADDWFQFIQGLNTAKVYKWAPKYYYPGQGGSWVIDLVMDDRKFTSGGTNEYPKNGAESEPAGEPKAGASIPFEMFWQAALQLVGKAKSVKAGEIDTGK